MAESLSRVQTTGKAENRATAPLLTSAALALVMAFAATPAHAQSAEAGAALRSQDDRIADAGDVPVGDRPQILQDVGPGAPVGQPEVNQCEIEIAGAVLDQSQRAAHETEVSWSEPISPGTRRSLAMAARSPS